jgi:hypothetical protein
MKVKAMTAATAKAIKGMAVLLVVKPLVPAKAGTQYVIS